MRRAMYLFRDCIFTMASSIAGTLLLNVAHWSGVKHIAEYTANKSQSQNTKMNKLEMRKRRVAEKEKETFDANQ